MRENAITNKYRETNREMGFEMKASKALLLSLSGAVLSCIEEGSLVQCV